jgi:hypothetical protein
MAYQVILHLQGEEPVFGEIEELPNPSDITITVNHPRRIDGKDLVNLAENVTTVIWPWSRLNFVEILPSREEEEIIGFVRE